MTVLARTLVETSAVPAAQTTQYTTAASTRAIIDKMTVTNTTGAAQTLSTALVPSGGAVGPATTVMLTQSIAAGTTYLCPEVVGHVLNPGDFISTLASAVGLTLRISGREVS